MLSKRLMFSEELQVSNVEFMLIHPKGIYKKIGDLSDMFVMCVCRQQY